VPIVITSAGNPKTYTAHLKQHGITVLHVVSSAKFALKCQEAGVDAVIAEGFEAGGHNGREETTTMCLVPAARQAIHIPLIAAGGIGSGASMLAAMVLGAEGVQVGSRFICTPEASSHESFKKAIVAAQEGDTELVLKRLTPVRLLKNPFYEAVKTAENHCVPTEDLSSLLGRGRAKKGMFEGDMSDGELEVGQISALINTITPAGDVLASIWAEFKAGCRFLGSLT
jgi:enoyl-[acyl-carrier protein] reductase II